MSQCQCTTAKGTQCSRGAKAPTNYCYQHQSCKTPVKGGISVTKVVVQEKPKQVSPVKPAKIASPKKPVTPVIPKVSPNPRKSSGFTSMLSEKPKIDAILAKLEQITEEKQLDQHWIYAPELANYLLTMDELQDMPDGGENTYVIAPQTYDTIDFFGANPDDFYEFDGAAVTGSGADQWILYKKGLLKALQSVYDKIEKTGGPLTPKKSPKKSSPSSKNKRAAGAPSSADKKAIEDRLTRIRELLIKEGGSDNPGEWVTGDDVFSSIVDNQHVGTDHYVLRYPYKTLEGPIRITKESLKESGREFPWLIYDSDLFNRLGNVIDRVDQRIWLSETRNKLKSQGRY